MGLTLFRARRGETQFGVPISLTSRERAHLKARAHSLDPVVRVGHAGVTDNVVAEVERALAAHELIKVSIDGADRTARIDTGNTLCERTGAAAVYRVGKIVVMWRPRPQQGEQG